MQMRISGGARLTEQNALTIYVRDHGEGFDPAQLPDPMLRVGVDNLPVTGGDRFSTTREVNRASRLRCLACGGLLVGSKATLPVQLTRFIGRELVNRGAQVSIVVPRRSPAHPDRYELVANVRNPALTASISIDVAGQHYVACLGKACLPIDGLTLATGSDDSSCCVTGSFLSYTSSQTEKSSLKMYAASS